MERFTFKKEERLSSLIVIGKLFSEGESFLAYPIKVVFVKTELPEAVPMQSSFSVSKRNFKRAVHRNLLKRRMREAFRLRKNEFYQSLSSTNGQLAVMFIFIGKQISDFAEIDKGMKSALSKMSRKLSEKQA